MKNQTQMQTIDSAAPTSVEEMARTKCLRCGKPIGYRRPFYGAGRDLVHADCEERAWRQMLDAAK